MTFLFENALNPLFTGVFGFFSFCAAFNTVPAYLLVIGAVMHWLSKAIVLKPPPTWGFHSEYKVLHGFKTLFLRDGTQNQFKKTHSRGAVRLAVNLS